MSLKKYVCNQLTFPICSDAKHCGNITCNHFNFKPSSNISIEVIESDFFTYEKSRKQKIMYEIA